MNEGLGELRVSKTLFYMWEVKNGHRDSKAVPKLLYTGKQGSAADGK